MAKPVPTRQATAPRRTRAGAPQTDRGTSGNGAARARAAHRRWLVVGPPPRALSMAGWALLPLRLFLGVTFCFAGLQKLANPNFFNSASPSGIYAQMVASDRVSPLHFLLGHLLRYSTPIGVLIALGELAVGLGALLGLWTRLAAVGGMLLSLTLFLTVSFHSSPYYTGADIVFFFAWIPLALAGSGGVLSLDAVIGSWVDREQGLAPPTLVPIPFSVIQQLCGNYEDDRCAAMRNAPCEVGPCPFLNKAGDRPVGLAGRPDEVDRRTMVLGTAAVAGVGVVGLLGAGLVAGIGRAVGGAKAPVGSSGASLPASASRPASGNGPTTTAPSNTTPTTAPASGGSSAAKPRGTAIGPAKDVPVGGWARFQDPSSGDPAIVLQQTKGTFAAYDAVCPHAGCSVGYAAGAKLIVCPCHGSEFNPANGDVLTGPAPTGLRTITIAEGSDGQLYVTD